MAASIDLTELIVNLQASVNPPGTDTFPDATFDDWLTYLKNGFWSAMIEGVIKNYTEEDGEVTPDSGTTPLSRELQQIVVIYAAQRAIRNQLRVLKTMDRGKAGPVEYETQQSAQLLKGLLDEMTQEKAVILARLSDALATNTYYLDSIRARDESINAEVTYWIGS